MILKKVPHALIFLILTAVICAAGHYLSTIYYLPYLNLAYPNFGIAFYISHDLIGLMYGLLMGFDLLWNNLRQKGKLQIDFVRLLEFILFATVLSMAYVSFFKATALLSFVNPQTYDNYTVFFMSAVSGYFLLSFLRKKESDSTHQKSDTFLHLFLPMFLTVLIFIVILTVLVGLGLFINVGLGLQSRYIFLSAFGLYIDSIMHKNIYPDLFPRICILLGLLMGLDTVAQKLYTKSCWRINVGRIFIVAAISIFLGCFYYMRNWSDSIGIAFNNNDSNRYLLFIVLAYNVVTILDRTDKKNDRVKI